jgi:hypothetical protein
MPSSSQPPAQNQLPQCEVVMRFTQESLDQVLMEALALAETDIPIQADMLFDPYPNLSYSTYPSIDEVVGVIDQPAKLIGGESFQITPLQCVTNINGNNNNNNNNNSNSNSNSNSANATNATNNTNTTREKPKNQKKAQSRLKVVQQPSPLLRPKRPYKRKKASTNKFIMWGINRGGGLGKNSKNIDNCVASATSTGAVSVSPNKIRL